MDNKKPDSFNSYFFMAGAFGIVAVFYVGYAYISSTREFSALSVNKDAVAGVEIKIPESDGVAEIQFDLGNGYKRRFAGNIYRGVTIAEAVNAAAKAGGMRIIWNTAGVYVSDGKAKVQKQLVLVYKNQAPISGDLKSMVISGSDEIELRVQ